MQKGRGGNANREWEREREEAKRFLEYDFLVWYSLYRCHTISISIIFIRILTISRISKVRTNFILFSILLTIIFTGNCAQIFFRLNKFCMIRQNNFNFLQFFLFGGKSMVHSVKLIKISTGFIIEKQFLYIWMFQILPVAPAPQRSTRVW